MTFPVRSHDLPFDHMSCVLQMTLMGMGVAIIAAQLRGELLGFITRYEQRMKLNALVFSIVSVVVSFLLCVTKLIIFQGLCLFIFFPSPDIHCVSGKMQQQRTMSRDAGLHRHSTS